MSLTLKELRETFVRKVSVRSFREFDCVRADENLIQVVFWLLLALPMLSQSLTCPGGQYQRAISPTSDQYWANTCNCIVRRERGVMALD